jgi:glycosyltransferase involved in cell wall biosynthesis
LQNHQGDPVSNSKAELECQERKSGSVVQPLLSVRVLTFNHSLFIRQCIESILMQRTNFPFEIVIGEDESTDGTREICKSYADQSPDRIRLMLRSEKDRIILNGVRTSRYNFIETMKDCRGEFIALMDGDDCWMDPLKLQKEVDFLTQHSGHVMTFHNALQADRRGRIISQSVLTMDQQRDVSSDELLRGWGPPVTSTMCFRNVIHQWPIEFFSVMNGDVFLISLLGKFGGGKYLSTISPSIYRLHPGSMFSSLPSLTWLEFSRSTLGHMAAYYARIEEPELASYFEARKKKLSEILKKPWKRWLFKLKRKVYILQMHYTKDALRNILNGIKQRRVKN